MDAPRCRIDADPGCVLPPREWRELDFYDGPLSGVIACGCCGAEYLFDTPDWRVEGGIDGPRLRRFFAAREATLAQLRAGGLLGQPLLIGGGEVAGGSLLLGWDALCSLLAAHAGAMQAVLLTDAYLDRCLGAVPEALHSDSRLQLPFHGHCPVPDGELVRRALAAMGRRPS